MKQIKYTLLLFLALLAGELYAGQTSPEASFRSVNKEYTWHADGSMTLRCRKELKLFTHTAMNSTYGETFITYNPYYESIKINESYTRQVDGTIIKTPENAFVEVLPSEAANAPAFNHLKELVIVHTGLELGATIFLDYTVTTKAGFYPGLQVNEILQESSPVEEYTITLHYAEGMKPSVRLFGTNTSLREEKNTFTATLKNIPARSREPYQVQNGDNKARLVASGYTNVFTKLRERFDPGSSNGFRQLTDTVTKNCKTEKERLEAILKFIRENIATSFVSMRETGYRLRNGEEVLRTVYGTEEEKLILLMTLLKSVGFAPEYIASFPAFIPKELYSFSTLKKVLLSVKADGKDFICNSSSIVNNDVAGRSEEDIFLTTDEERLTPPAIEPVNIKKELKVDGTPDENGFIIYTLPSEWEMPALSTIRSTVFELSAPINNTYSYIVKIPEQSEWLKGNQNITLKNKAGSYSQTITQDDKTLKVSRSLQISKKQFSVTEYKELRLLLNQWKDTNQRILLFKTK